MKIKHLFGLAVIAAMTASCSSNEDLGTAGPGTGTNEAGVGYATFSINLPTTSGTRANDQFEEGTLSEYAVNDATLLIFKKAGTSENNYTFVETVPLGNLEPWKKDNTTGTGITTEATITAKLEGATVGEGSGGKGSDYYALVILNNKDKDNKDKVSMPVSTTSTTDTYGTWNASANATNLLDNTKGFYMANAPEFTEAGVEPTTLVQIKGIYRTKEEAQSKPGTTIHVERGLAKVTVKSSPNNYFAEGGANVTGSNYSSDKVQITNWALDVTNKKSFPVHVTSGLKGGTTTSEGETVTGYPDIWKNESGTTPATSRFVSQLPGTGAFKRVYWGIDPNYSTNYTTVEACKGAFNVLGNAEITGNVANPLYCLENTFDISHMMQGQTTRVIFKAKYTPKDGLAETDGTFYTIGNMTTILKKADLEPTVNNAATSVLPGCTVDYKNLETGGSHVITLADIKYGTPSAVLEAEKIYGTKKGKDIVKEINDKLGLKAGVGINTYLKGVTYYIARIKHFGNDLTPWAAGNETYGANNDANNTKYLGRYGVLRNNLYDLTINTISGPGYPDVPEVKPTDPDDEDTKYISVSVKILDWAKRSDTLDL